MRLRLLALFLVACAHKSAPSETPPSSAAPPAAPEATTALALGPAGTCAVGGVVVAKATGEGLAGVTIVLTLSDGTKSLTTDSGGNFLVHPEVPPTAVAIYYADLTESIPYTASQCGQGLRVTLDLAKEN